MNRFHARVVLALCVGLSSVGVITFAAAKGVDQPEMPVLPAGVKDADDLPDAERVEYEDALLQSARPVAETDRDLTTIEGVLPDGRRLHVTVQSSDPESLAGTDIDEFAGEKHRVSTTTK